MVDSCVFCKIIAGELPAKVEYKDEFCMAFHDINPRASTHVLVIPIKHLATLKDMTSEDEVTMGKVFKTARDVAEKLGLRDYRLLMSVGKKAGQEVFHAHLHIMSV